MIKIRCSQLGSIMANGKVKGELSVGAKTYVKDLAKQHVFGYTKKVNTKEMAKGIMVEQDSIDLLNEVLFRRHQKNVVRLENDWIGGTADVVCPTGIIHDLKSSWSINSFPATVEDGHDSNYEWQVRGYMMLWDIDRAEVDYCLCDTPEDLIGWEDPAAHIVSHIDPLLRVTRVPYTREKALEDTIRQKVELAQRYFEEMVESIHATHGTSIVVAA